LRELLRTRKQLGRQQSRHIQRLQKTLEGANIKLDSVITYIVGKSGRAMIRALIAGEVDPVKLAALAWISTEPDLPNMVLGQIAHFRALSLRNYYAKWCADSPIAQASLGTAASRFRPIPKPSRRRDVRRRPPSAHQLAYQLQLNS
jgi:hypothetical protein